MQSLMSGVGIFVKDTKNIIKEKKTKNNRNTHIAHRRVPHSSWIIQQMRGEEIGRGEERWITGCEEE
ncbi:hypothetical protein EYF80_026929 [Liparis tanakae]|uniref:Uncharacterized protein n=1 Tax=Liparis tanakae TaxID=230148 RepID=A0A4Z2HD84_9TELE|nr:hypothetical protein EYF80_026929 [Liparis tanakae]